MIRNLSLKSGNPALNIKAFKHLSGVSDDPMTLNGVVNKTGICLGLLMLAAIFGYLLDSSSLYGITIFAGLAGLGIVILTNFKKHLAPYTAPVYAIVEGIFLGMVSSAVSAVYGNIVAHAVFITLGIFGVMLFLYKSRIIKVTQKFKLGMAAALGGIFIFYLINFIIFMFNPSSTFAVMQFDNGSWFSIGFSVVIVIIASLTLVLDFERIEEGCKYGSPKYMEWYGALGLMVTLAWIYFEVLRLLTKLNSRN